MVRLRWKGVCFVVLYLLSTVIFLCGKQMISESKSVTKKSFQDKPVTGTNATLVTIQDVKTVTKNRTAIPALARAEKTLHTPNLANSSICVASKITPAYVAARHVRVLRMCSVLTKAVPLMRRRQPSLAQLFKLRWDRRHHVLYCPVPQVGPAWTRYMLEPVGVTNLSVSSDSLNDLLRQHLPPPSREELIVSPLTDNLKVMVTRHPFTRLEAAYQMIVRETNYKATSTPSLQARTAEKLPLMASFREFIRYVLDTTETWLSSPHLPPPDDRWMPVTFMCAPCTFKYDIISKAECFESDTRIIEDHCHQKTEVVKKTDTLRPQGTSKKGGVRTSDEPHCKGSANAKAEVNDRKSYSNSNTSYWASNKDSFTNVRGLISQLSGEEFDRLYNIYKYDFEMMEYSPL
ncbi:carbohydrate sulfotransferase 11-like [Eriocheir sinensis]|uniref:carbohydrate sulfotransferase 11-like n=1 Tax=Eriocheir sinensis TaxID=95602 RepID=UPI0021C894D4|nr:carbohydrate sulfotransferase 11-like [Eriocheir sinensis]